MNRQDAKKLAETITNEQIKQMFDKAKDEIKDWTVVSSVNKGMTKGAAWNILASRFDITSTHHVIAKTNMIREFGYYLPDELKPTKKPRKKHDIKATHQEPIFNY